VQSPQVLLPLLLILPCGQDRNNAVSIAKAECLFLVYVPHDEVW
jgi:hypothetical protein